MRVLCACYQAAKGGLKRALKDTKDRERSQGPAPMDQGPGTMVSDF